MRKKKTQSCKLSIRYNQSSLLKLISLNVTSLINKFNIYRMFYKLSYYDDLQEIPILIILRFVMLITIEI